MMEMWITLSLVVLGLIILLLVVFLKRRKKEQWKEPNYRFLFIMGCSFFVLGIVFDFTVFLILGLVYLTMGLANRKKWGKKRRPLNKKQMRTQKIVMVVLVVLVILVVVVFILVEEFYFISSPECGIENCHGLDITCGPDVPDVCTEIHQIGDRCRQYVSCEVDGECKLVESERFVECKACVDKCLEDFADDGSKAFECESEC